METPKYMQIKYIDNCIKQTLLWMNGISKHMNDECCIDFSCCFPDLLFKHDKILKIGEKKLEELHVRRKSIASYGD